MRKNKIFKTTIVLLLMIMLISCMVPKKVYAEEGTWQTELDTTTGIIIEPTLEFFTFFVDSIMSVFSKFMIQQDFEFVMQEEPINNVSNIGTTITIDNTELEEYKNFVGNLKIKYPNFTYSPEDIFSGKIDLLDVNFISNNNNDSGWLKIRSVIAEWYNALRVIALIGLLSILIYTGIKIIISATAQDKAKYKERIINWFVALALLFVMHYLMAFIVTIIEEITQLLGNITGLIKVNIDGKSFTTNLIGLARFKMQQIKYTAKIGHFIIYVALVVFTFKFTFLYFKRMLKMAFLTLIAPLIALMYPIDKMEGKAEGFNMWLKEYIYNMLLQPMHLMLYYILISSSLTLAAKNPIYAIAVILFISQAEKLLKTIFGFGRAKGGTVGGIVGAYATGRLAGAITDFIKKPIKTKKSSGGKTKSNSSENYEDDMPETIDDTGIDEIFIGFGLNDNVTIDENSYISTIQANSIYNQGVQDIPVSPLNIDKTIEEYRRHLEELYKEFPELSFNDGNGRTLEQLFNDILSNQEKLKQAGLSDEEIQRINEEIFKDKKILFNRNFMNEFPLTSNQIPLQYIDGDTRSLDQITESILANLEKANDLKYSAEERKEFLRLANRDKALLNRRMSENNHIAENMRQANNIKPKTEEKSGSFASRVSNGMTKVGRKIVKPVWDTEKSLEYNGKRILKTAANGAKVIAGATVGTATAAVQAGISITDGNYKVGEGIASFAAGTGGGVALINKVTNKENPFKEKETIQEYATRWYDRDDVIKNFNDKYGNDAKELRQRVREEYVVRGIVDFKEQKEALKFADHLVKQGIDQKEADRLSVAILQYKQTLIRESNYYILYDKKKMEQYLDVKQDAYKGSLSKDAIRKKHREFLEYVREFDRING